MKTRLKLSLLLLTLTLAVSVRAHARGHDDHHHNPGHCDPPATAPEVNPSIAFAGLTLLGGTLTVLRSRRRQ